MVQEIKAAETKSDTTCADTVDMPEPSQAQINREEWKNPMNWGGPTTMAVYFSKKDTRIWVPQHKPSVGWTLNLAHTGGILWMVGICVGMILVLMILSGWIFSDQILHALQ